VSEQAGKRRLDEYPHDARSGFEICEIGEAIRVRRSDASGQAIRANRCRDSRASVALMMSLPGSNNLLRPNI
jgi:hypothetical protein